MYLRADRVAVVAAALLMANPLLAQREPHAKHAAPARPPEGVGLGEFTFANSGARAAQGPFQRGVGFLHNFEYEGAVDAFREAQRADPRLALAYWFEALSYSQTVWGTEDLAASRRALVKLGSTPAARLAKAPSPRERAFGAAVEALYAEGTFPTRVRAFADSLRRLAGADTTDHEAPVFAAIALLSAAQTAPATERATLEREAAELAERVFAANPRHPGATHFVIHANDTPERAHRALPAARAYAEIAPASEHAQHMPSHIFVQLGYWDDAALTNERAWAASRAEVAKRKLPLHKLNWHVLSWLEYAYLQQGRLREARSLIDSARTFLAGQDLSQSIDGRFAIALMEYLFASSSGRWDAWSGSTAATMPRQGAQPREVSFALGAAYWTALVALHRGGGTAADSIIRLLRERAAASAAAGVPRRGAGVALAQLEALLLAARGARDSAIVRLSAAAAAQDSAPPVGPPFVLPSAELLGRMLLEAGRPRDAAAAYERALHLCPNRAASLLGLARARAKAGEAAGATQAYQQLLAIWHRADADLPELAEARAAAPQTGAR